MQKMMDLVDIETKILFSVQPWREKHGLARERSVVAKINLPLTLLHVVYEVNSHLVASNVKYRCYKLHKVIFQRYPTINNLRSHLIIQK